MGTPMTPTVFTVYPADGTAAASRLRDRRFGTMSEAQVAAEEAAVETGEPVSIEQHERGGETVRAWTMRPDGVLTAD